MHTIYSDILVPTKYSSAYQHAITTYRDEYSNMDRLASETFTTPLTAAAARIWPLFKMTKKAIHGSSLCGMIRSNPELHYGLWGVLVYYIVSDTLDFTSTPILS